MGRAASYRVDRGYNTGDYASALAYKPHRLKTFKLSRDPKFAEKVIDVVGLYLNPPDNALVLSVDEKTQIQALDRTHPMLPLRPGQVARRTHDYKRHGTANLYAAFNVATGEVLGRITRRHRATEFRQFLAQIDRATPPELALHLIVDNSSTHTTAAIRSASTAPSHKARFPQHLGRRRRCPQQPQATSSVLSTRGHV